MTKHPRFLCSRILSDPEIIHKPPCSSPKDCVKQKQEEKPLLVIFLRNMPEKDTQEGGLRNPPWDKIFLIVKIDWLFFALTGDKK